MKNIKPETGWIREETPRKGREHERGRAPRIMGPFASSARVIVQSSFAYLDDDQSTKRQLVQLAWGALQVYKVAQGLAFAYAASAATPPTWPSGALDVAVGAARAARVVLEYLAGGGPSRGQSPAVPTRFLAGWATMDALTVAVVLAAQVRNRNNVVILQTRRQAVELWLVLVALSAALFAVLNGAFVAQQLAPIVAVGLGGMLGNAAPELGALGRAAGGPAVLPPPAPAAPAPGPGVPGAPARGAGEADSAAADAGEHLFGSAAVHVLPYSVVHLNPEGRVWCLGANQARVGVPLEFHGVGPWVVDYERVSPSGHVTAVTGVRFAAPAGGAVAGPARASGAAAERFTKRHHTAELSVKEPGTYRVTRVLDESLQSAGRVLAASATLVHCPSARLADFAVQDAPRRETAFGDAAAAQRLDREVCLGDSVRVRVVASGVPPFHVWYVQGDGGAGAAPRMVKVTLGAAGRSLETSVADVPLELVPRAAGTTVVSVVRVMDGLNNTVEYPPTAAGERPRDAAAIAAAAATTLRLAAGVEREPVLASRGPDLLVVRALGRAHVTLDMASCRSAFVREDGIDAGRALKVQVYHDRPVEVVYSINGEKQRPLQLNPGAHDLPVSGPGTYALETVADASSVCGAAATGQQSCLVAAVMPPTAELSTSSRTEPCIGTSGLDVDLALTGVPPFWIEYSLVHGAAAAVQRVGDISTHRHLLSLRPRESGLHTFRFLRVGDAVYREGVPLPANATAEYDQYIHPPSTARFVGYFGGGGRAVRCPGDSAELEIELSGAGPWREVRVERTLGRTRTSLALSNVTGSRATISTGPLERAGVYTFSLAGLVDAKGCTFGAGDSNEAVVEVLQQRPTITFTCPASGEDPAVGKTTVAAGRTARLGILATGFGPFDVTVRDRLANPPRLATVHLSAGETGELETAVPAELELVGVKDRFCQGSAVGQTRCAATALPTPSAVLDKAPGLESDADDGFFGLAGECADAVAAHGTPADFEVVLAGEPPFHVRVAVYRSDARVTWADVERAGTTLAGLLGQPVTTFEVDLGQHRGHVPLVRPSAAPGFTYWHVTRVADAHYPDGVSPSRRNGTAPLVVRQELFASPDALFGALPPQSYRTAQGLPALTFCGVGTASPGGAAPDYVLPVHLFGKAPFSVKLESRFRSHAPRNRTLDAGTHTLSVPLGDAAALVGVHSVAVVAVADGNGCSSQFALDGSGTRAVQRNAAEPALQLSSNGSASVLGESRGDRPAARVRIVEMLDAVSVHALSPRVVCHGTLLKFVLRGRPPFSVRVRFTPLAELEPSAADDGTYRLATRSDTESNPSRLIAGADASAERGNVHDYTVPDNFATLEPVAPGLVEVLQVCDRAGCCRSTEHVAHHVRPLPRATLATRQADAARGNSDSDAYLYEGDDVELAISLVGEPPFSFNYARSELGAAGEPAEDIVVTGVTSHEHHLRTGVSGVYRLTFIADRFCSFPAHYRDQPRDVVGSLVKVGR